MRACIVRRDTVVGCVWASMAMALHVRLIMVGVMMKVAGRIVGISRAWFTLHSRIVPVPEVDSLVIAVWITPS